MNKAKLQIAREFRKKLTKSEKIMWGVIRNRKLLGLKFKRQYVIDGYIIDFYCHELRLAIEIDGSVHYQEEQMKYDEERQKIIEQNNIRFIRINNEAVEININKILKELKILINKLKTLN